MSFITPYNPLKYLKSHVNPIILDKLENGTLLSPSADLLFKLLSRGAVIQWPISIEGQHSVVKKLLYSMDKKF